ncbi:MAG: zinc ribbon domain-containing protein, partial [Bellilinea sp.]|nr:zinc ribbon domain-containing protein [Bellilinea sp.]
MSKTFHCPNCGAPLQEPPRDQGVVSCTYCHSSVIVPAELRRTTSGENVLTPAESLFNLPGLASSLREAANLTRAGRQEEAARLLQEKLGMDAAESSRVITQMEQGQIVQIGEVENRFSGQTVTLSSEDANQIMELLNEGQEAQALQHYRQITGAGAEDAQQAINAMRLAANLLAQPIRSNNQQTARIAKGAASIFAFSSCLTFLITSLVSLLTVGIVFWALVSDGGPLEAVSYT